MRPSSTARRCTGYRDRLVRRRPAVINQIRAFLLERSVTPGAQRRRNLELGMPRILADEALLALDLACASWTTRVFGRLCQLDTSKNAVLTAD